VDRTYLFTYIVPLIGVFVLAAGIGGAVLGSYAPVQNTFGLCGAPEMTVFASGETTRVTSPGGFEYPQFRYEELSEPARSAFEEALESPTNKHGVEGDLPPDEREALLASGGVITYEGMEYYTALTAHPCVNVAPLLLPVSFLALALGAAGMLTPIVWRRRIGRPLHGGDTGNVRSALAPFRDGPYQGIGGGGSFGAASLVSLVPLSGPLLGGSSVGAVAPTTRRAAVLGTYLGALITGVLAVAAVLLPPAFVFVPPSIIALLPFAGFVNPLLVTIAVIVAPLPFAPVSAAVTRRATRSL
jgi:hypothetical protein